MLWLVNKEDYLDKVEKKDLEEIEKQLAEINTKKLEKLEDIVKIIINLFNY